MSKKKHKHSHKFTRPLVLETPAEKAVYNTLLYRSIFDYPMSFYQIGTFLISDRTFTAEELKEAINNLFRKEIIDIKGSTYYLTRHNTVNWQLKSKESKTIISKAAEISNVLAKIPWIKLIGVTGSIASFNGSKDDDIDLFIVSSPNRVWLTRLFTVLLLKSLNLYRTNKDYAGKFCPNIFVDEQNTSWEEKNENVYIAHEICMMHPIYQTNDSYFEFLNTNTWVKNYLGNFNFHYTKAKNSPQHQSHFFNFLEFWSRIFQLTYMKKNKTTEITKSGIIHFNKKDWSKKVLSEYTKKPQH